MYFARWPIQENAFKDGAAIGIQEHRGNCGRMVANVAVITELERLEARAKLEEAERVRLVDMKVTLEEEYVLLEREHQRAVSALSTRRGRLDVLVTQGLREGKQLGFAAIEHQEAMVRAETAALDCNAAKQALLRNDARVGELETNRATVAARREKLEPQRTIRQLDVALDSVLTAAKLTCALLITFALREYLAAMPVTPHTFVSRLFSIRGRKEIRPDEERIYFYENPRDPEVNAVLADACLRLNKRRLSIENRQLRYEMAHSDGSQFD